MTSKLKANFFLVCGWVCVTLGIIGIPTPILPTTPFLLLAAYCFARGSQRWHDWLISHNILGPYILAFRDQKGLTVKQKWRIASSIILTLAVTFWLAPRIEGRLGVLLIGGGWLIWLYRYQTAPTTIASPAADQMPPATPALAVGNVVEHEAKPRTVDLL